MLGSREGKGAGPEQLTSWVLSADVQAPRGRHVHGKHVHPQLQAALRKGCGNASGLPSSTQQGQLSSPPNLVLAGLISFHS